MMEILEDAQEAVQELIPQRSKERYLKEYETFQGWREMNNVSVVTEDVLLAYFRQQSEVIKPTTLWSKYSMLKTTLKVNEDVDISKYAKLSVFLKRNNKGYQPKKSKTLTREQVNKFLVDAPDSVYLMIKVCTIIGVSGACRRDELWNMCIDDVKVRGPALLVNIRNAKTYKPRVFMVMNEGAFDHVGMFRKYVALRPKNVQHKKLFLFYSNGRCTVQPVGVHTFAKMPRKIAEFLGLPDACDYTGHCFRRTSATLLADNGADVRTFKYLGGWHLSTVAESCLDDSVLEKTKISYSETSTSGALKTQEISENLALENREEGDECESSDVDVENKNFVSCELYEPENKSITGLFEIKDEIDLYECNYDGSTLRDHDVKVENDPLFQEQQSDESELVYVEEESNSNVEQDTNYQVTMNSMDSLLKTPFHQRQLEEKLKIKELGRPTPELKMTQSGRSKDRRFKEVIYDSYGWICGCEIRDALFCFPCVLFGNTDAHGWSKTGVKDLSHLKALCKKHNDSRTHKHNVLNLAMLGSAEITTQLSRAYYSSIRAHNDNVAKNRRILSRIVDCIKFCGAFELALQETENVDFVSSLDTAVKEQMELNPVFKGNSKAIQNELLDAMLEVCRKKIIEDMRDAEFVAIMAEDTTDLSEQIQLVIMFRYEKNGAPFERFWGFLNPEAQNAEAVAKCILKVVDEIFKDEPEKIVALSYDGASLVSGRLGREIKSHYPNAHYIHCYAHQLNSVMERAASQNASARVFFCNLSAFPSFFSRSPQRLSTLDAVVSRHIPSGSATRWNFRSRTVNVVYEHRNNLVECLSELKKSPSSSTVREASGLCLYLENEEFLFWLLFFQKITPHVDMLEDQLQARLNDALKTKRATTEFIEALKEIQQSTDNIDNEVTFGNKRRKVSCRNADAKEVCDRIVQEASHRFQYLDHLAAEKLLSSINFPEFSRQFPTNELEATVNTYNMLDKCVLKTELTILYERREYRKVDGAVPLLKLILKNDLQEAFSELTKLLRIIITTPMPTAEPERCFSSLKRIKTFLRNTISQENLSALAMLSVEKKMIADMNGFNSSVIDVFCSKNDCCINFTFHQ